MGEAAVPGPVDFCEVTFAAVNPTTVLDKVADIANLNVSVIVLSETAATSQVQQCVNPRIRGMGYTAHWGCPVPVRFHPASGTPSRRGAALGTAIFSRLPSRGSVTPLQPEAYSSCRISESLIRLPCMEIRVLAAYGIPRCLPQASARNNLLLTWLYERATASSLPCLIAGDFNCLPTTLPAWQSFASRGWCELGSFMKDTQQVDLPATCRESTRFDTFLLPPALQQHVHSASVLQPSPFDSHSPMLLTLQVPGAAWTPWIWRLPCSWAPLDPCPAQVQHAYAGRERNTSLLGSTSAFFGDKLVQWSKNVEGSVDQALRSRVQHTPQDLPSMPLPAKCRGRCRPRQRIQGVASQLPRRGREGDVQPETEATGVRVRQRLRQCRLSTLARGLFKLEQLTGDRAAVVRLQLLLQWQATARLQVTLVGSAPGSCAGQVWNLCRSVCLFAARS